MLPAESVRFFADRPELAGQPGRRRAVGGRGGDARRRADRAAPAAVAGRGQGAGWGWAGGSSWGSAGGSGRRAAGVDRPAAPLSPGGRGAGPGGHRLRRRRAVGPGTAAGAADRAAPSVLIAIFAGFGRRVEISLPVEGLHFGVIRLRPAARGRGAVHRRRQPVPAGEQPPDKPTVTAGFRDADRGVLNVTGLVERLSRPCARPIGECRLRRCTRPRSASKW